MPVLRFVTQYIFPPVIGGLIGLFTNWLALQMLFHPYKPIYLGKIRLPLTPGIIPKRKAGLARAIGKAVAEEVLTEKELTEVFRSPGMKEKFVGAVLNLLYDGPALSYFTVDTHLMTTFSESIADRIVHAAIRSDIESLLSTCGLDAIKAHVNNPLLSLVINDKLLSSIGKEIATALKKYLYQNGKEMLAPKIEEELNSLTQKNGGELLTELQLTQEKVKEILIELYDSFTAGGLKKLLDPGDVATVIENKINEMDIKQIAELTFRIMNKEMKAVILLGGLLGALIGVINIFI